MTVAELESAKKRARREILSAMERLGMTPEDLRSVAPEYTPAGAGEAFDHEDSP